MHTILPVTANQAHAAMDQTATTPSTDATTRLRSRVAPSSRWENEGCIDNAVWPSAEAAQLRMRVIALENLVIALLARTPDEQVVLAREMAIYISPRPGYTAHHLTLRAADQMRSLIDRSAHFRTTPVA